MGLLGASGGGSGAGAAARAKAEMYGKLAEALAEKRDAINTEFDLVKILLESVHAQYTSNATSAEGLILTTFDLHEGNWKTKYGMIISKIEMGVVSLDGLIDRAKALQDIWNTQAEMEIRMEAIRASGRL